MPASPSTDLLLITSASGKQASSLLPFLSSWKRLRLAVHTPVSAARLQQLYPHAEVISTDLYSPTAIRALMADVTVAIHIGPSYHPHEAAIGTMMVDAAVREREEHPGGLKHFVYSSVLHPQISKMLNHAAKLRVEEALVESGLPYTILQPTTFMDNLPVEKLAAEESPVFKCAWNPDRKFSWIATGDLGEAMYTVLQEREKHFYATYELVGTRVPVSFGEVMKLIGDKIGKEIRVEEAGFKEAVEGLLVRLYGTSERDRRRRDAAERMILYYDGRGLVGNSTVLEFLIGREGTGVQEWVDGRLGS